MTKIVFVVNHLGAAYGGINVFNAEIISALKAYQDLNTICIVPSVECVDNSLAHLTHILPLKKTGSDFSSVIEDATLATMLLKEIGQVDAIVGHDVVTGELALEIGDRIGVKKILIHHMAYGRYIALMRSPEDARAKEKFQQNLFPRADQSFAVGPLLLDSLEDIRRMSPQMPAPKLLIPPLLDTLPVLTARSAPRILYLGRIESDNDAVKQGFLAAKAIGRALNKLPEKTRDATVDIYGFDADPELAEKFRTQLDTEAGYRVAVKCLNFIYSRSEMIDVIKDASLVVMPSVHEGFGMVAWEAMCCGVPLVVSRNSGFYRYIESLGLAKFVDSISVADHNTEEGVNQQVDELANRILSRIDHPFDAHIRAEKLLLGVRANDNVKMTLNDFVSECGYECSSVSGSLLRKPSTSKLYDPLDVDLTIEVDVGLDDQERVEFRCLTSTKRIMSAFLAVQNGIEGPGVKVKSSYLEKLFEMAESDPDEDMRADAAVRYRADKPKVENLGKFLNKAFFALASPQFVDMAFMPDNYYASAFLKFIESLMSPHKLSEGKTYIDAVRFNPYENFSIWIPKEILERKPFYATLFTIDDGATLADLWFDCPDEIAAAYLRSCLSKSVDNDASPPSLGNLLDWAIGSH